MICEYKHSFESAAGDDDARGVVAADESGATKARKDVFIGGTSQASK